MIQEVNDTTFEAEVLKANIPVLVKFGASWCGKCKAIQTTLGSISKEYEGRIKMVSVDVEKCPELTEKYDIISLPVLCFFNDGKQGSDLPSMLPKSKLVELIEVFLKGDEKKKKDKETHKIEIQKKEKQETEIQQAIKEAIEVGEDPNSKTYSSADELFDDLNKNKE